jgi:hypothetical protein
MLAPYARSETVPEARHLVEWILPEISGMTSRHANRIIRQLEEFAPGHFELAQLTRITPEQFPAIAPAVHDRQILANGEAIALIPENSEKIALAVATLRREAAPQKEAAKQDRVAAGDRDCEEVLAENSADRS